MEKQEQHPLTRLTREMAEAAKHPSSHTLAYYALFPRILSIQDKNKVVNHVVNCKGCQDTLKHLRDNSERLTAALH